MLLFIITPRRVTKMLIRIEEDKVALSLLTH
jgi:hypothetical protein